jgi:hypothetical protein
MIAYKWGSTRGINEKGMTMINKEIKEVVPTGIDRLLVLTRSFVGYHIFQIN